MLNSLNNTSNLSSNSTSSLKQKSKNFIEINKNKIKKIEPQQSDIIIKCLNDGEMLKNDIKITKRNEKNDVEIDVSIHSSIAGNEDYMNENSKGFGKEQSCLVQGDEVEIENDLNNFNRYNQDEDEVVIDRNEYDKSKFRSQFMQRFGMVQNKKQQVIPTIIDSAYDTTSLKKTSSYSNLDTDSLVDAMNKVTQPIVKIQNDLESKITSVIKQLEVLRRSEEDLIPQLIEKRQNDPIRESEARIKHLEMIQENQFKLMSQLIEKIGEMNKQDLEETKNYEMSEIKEPKVVHLTSTKLTKPVKKRSKSKKEQKSRQSSCETCDRSKSRGRSPTKKIPPRPKSKSPQKIFNEEFDRRSEFLKDLLDKVPTQSPDSSVLLVNENNKPVLFDKYLNEAKELKSTTEILKSSTKLLNEIEKEDFIGSNLDLNKKEPIKQSMFSDIKDVLKKIENTKSKLDVKLTDLNRNDKMFYLLNPDQEDNDRLRIKKMVDGCVSAISSDVKRVVSQKLIDETKHVKLEAERDTGGKSRIKKSQSLTQTNQTKSTAPKNVSDYQKYLGKIYGKGLLEQIKFEQQEEKLREQKKELEFKKKLELEKQNLKKVASYQQQQQQQQQQRPAFVTKPVEAYPENKIKSFSNFQEIRQTLVHQQDNIGIVTIMPRHVSPPKQAKMFQTQSLPLISINPSMDQKSTEKRVNFKQVDIKVIEDDTQVIKEDKHVIIDEESEESGTGIELTGSKQTQQVPHLDLNEDFHRPIGEINSDQIEFMRQRNLYENRVLDWLEQEILQRFFKYYQIDEDTSDEYEQQENINLHIDVGEEVDPNLIECLINEVLNEKIHSMFQNKVVVEDEMVPNQKSHAPVPSPRKSFEFLEKQKEKSVEFNLKTPEVTPSQSPRNSPPPEKENQDVNFNLIKLIEEQDDSESILEVTIENDEFDFDQNQAGNNPSIVVPPTPKETPQPSPTPPETPSISIQEAPKVAEIIPEKIPTPPPIQPIQPPPAPIKNFTSTSIQCDPIPVLIKQDTILSTELEESSSYSSDNSSTTINTEEKTEDESSSYFSDGAWLMSKSEGEIINHNQNNYVNLDMENAVRGMLRNPRKVKGTNDSDGEIKIEDLNANNFYSKMKKQSGVNLIKIEQEQGEVNLKPNRRNSAKSEGEIENPAIQAVNKQREFLIENKISKKEPKKEDTKKKKNNIKIRPIPNEILVRDSNDLERKMYSSTPDTSMFISNQLATSNQILLDDYENYQEHDNQDEQEVSIHIDEDLAPKLKNKKQKFQISSIFSSTKQEDDEDTLNNTFD